VIWDNSQFVSVGSGRILTSTDGINWTIQLSKYNESFKKIEWNGSQFLVVGWYGRILTSPDGTNWSEQSAGLDSPYPNFEGSAWDGTQWVIVGSNRNVLTSSDGINWNSQYIPIGGNFISIAWNGVQFMAISRTGSVITSPDGKNWTWMSEEPLGDDVRKIVSIGDDFFITTNESGIWIKNILGWEQIPSNISFLDNIIKADNRFYGVAYKSVFRSLLCASFEQKLAHVVSFVNPNSSSLSVLVHPYGDDTEVWIEWGVSNSYGSSTAKQIVSSSNDFQKLVFTFPGIDVSTIHYRIVAKNSIGTVRRIYQGALHKEDIILTESDNDDDGTPDSIDLDDDNDGIPDSYELALGWDTMDSSDEYNDSDGDGFTDRDEYDAGSNPLESTSKPISWLECGVEIIYRSDNINLGDLVWNGSLFVIVGDKGRILTSINENIWDVQVSGTDSTLNSIIWDSSKLIAVGSGGTILTSTYGINWVEQNSGTVEYLNKIKWNGSQYIVVGNNGKILTSLDGSNWSTENSKITDSLLGIEWDGSQWIVVGHKGRILTSSDGSNWSLQNSYSTEMLQSVAKNDTDIMVLSSNGNILRSNNGINWAIEAKRLETGTNEIYWNGSEFLITSNNAGLWIKNALGWKQIITTFNSLDNVIQVGKQVYGVASKSVFKSSSCGFSQQRIPHLASTTINNSSSFSIRVHPYSSNTDVWIEWGNSTSYENSSEKQFLSPSTDYNELSFPLEGILGSSAMLNKRYTFLRAVAKNKFGTVFGKDYIFDNDKDRPDIDNDGVPDYRDNCLNITNSAQKDEDGDLQGDVCDEDNDNDGITNSFETTHSMNPLDPSDAYLDYDQDGYTNLQEYRNNTDPRIWNAKVLSLSNWKWSNPKPSGNKLRAIEYGNGKFVIGADEFILTSSDGISWNEHNAEGVFISNIVFDGSKFVAVGSGQFTVGKGLQGNGFYTSLDGIQWSKHNSLIAYDLAWNGSIYVAVGDYKIYTSSDGILWNEKTIEGIESARLVSVVWGKDKFVAVGTNGKIITSSDGQNWNIQSSGTNNWLVSVAWGNNTFVATDIHSVLSSPDGVNWTRNEFSYVYNPEVKWAANQFIVLAQDGKIVTSSDGISWTHRQNPENARVPFVDLAWSGKKIVAVSSDGDIIYSSDGIKWESSSSAITHSQLTDIVWNGNRFVALSKRGERITSANGDYIYTSTNGVIWNKRALGMEIDLKSVIWGSNQFITVGEKGYIFTSPKGMIWTQQQSPTNNYLEKIVWNGSQYIAVGEAGTIISSTESTNWIQRQSPTSQKLLGITWYGNKFIASDSDGTITSTDGVNWERGASIDFRNTRVSFASNGKILVAAGFHLLTSPDGINWTTVLPYTSYMSIIWDDFQFFAINLNGQIYTSDSGEKWDILDSKIRVYTLAIAKSTDQYVVVGSNGAILNANRDNCVSQVSGELLNSGSDVFGNFSCGNSYNDYVIKSGKTIIWDGKNGPLTGNIQIQPGGTLRIGK